MDKSTDWNSQMVIVTKKSGNICFCIDPRPLNKALKHEQYQLLTIEEVLPKLTNAKYFTKVDVASAYWHVVLDDESNLLTTFQTGFG